MTTSTERGRIPLRIGIVALLLFVAGPLLAHFAIVPAIVGFGLFVAGGAVGLLNSVAAIVAFRRGARARGLAAMVLSEVPALLLIVATVRGAGPPPINDITSDLAEPPAFVHAKELPENRGRDLAYPESFKQIVRGAYPDLKPLVIEKPPDEVFAAATRVAGDMPGWRITAVDGSNRTFEGVATSELFRFRDDFVVRVRPEGSGSVVDMRSKSRDGKGDLGANAVRIRDFFARLSSPKT